MDAIKVIPCLDIQNGRVVKGVHFKDMKDAGDPIECIERYCAEGADEIWLLDISASTEGRKTNLDMVKAAAAHCTVPLCVGGGIKSLDDADAVMAAGASKVGVGSAALHNDEVVRRVSYKYGVNATTALVDTGDLPKNGDTVVLYNQSAKGVLAAGVFHSGALTISQVKDYLEAQGIPVLHKDEIDLDAIKFDEKGLVPAIAQDAQTGTVLMLAYMNRESLTLTLRTKLATYFSRSRQELWVKGATSGHYQHVREVRYDCDGDAILLKVDQQGAACHTGNYSCFFNPLLTLPGGRSSSMGMRIIQSVYDQVLDRKAHPKEGSYTNMLLNKGVDKIGKKVVEEAAEVLIAAKNRSREEVSFEVADLMYHLTVLLADQGMCWDDIYAELENRHR